MENLLLLLIVSFIFNSTIAAIISGLIKFFLFKKKHAYSSLLQVGMIASVVGLVALWILLQFIDHQSMAIYFLIFLMPVPFVLVGLVIQTYRLTIHLQQDTSNN